MKRIRPREGDIVAQAQPAAVGSPLNADRIDGRDGNGGGSGGDGGGVGGGGGGGGATGNGRRKASGGGGGGGARVQKGVEDDASGVRFRACRDSLAMQAEAVLGADKFAEVYAFLKELHGESLAAAASGKDDGGSGGGGLEDMSVKQRQKMVRKRFGQTGKIQDAVFLVDQLLYIEENFLPTSSAKK